jgi:hypothetical protein
MTTPVSAPKIEGEPDVNAKAPVNIQMTSLPSWYRIPEINKETYLSVMKPLYDIIEGKKVSKSEPDPFAQQGWMLFHKMKSEEWEHEHKKIQIERAWTMAWGDFHHNLMGTFPGWKNYKKGHATGCDIGKEDDTCVGEVKNNTNTMNSSSKESVLAGFTTILHHFVLYYIRTKSLNLFTKFNEIVRSGGINFYKLIPPVFTKK